MGPELTAELARRGATVLIGCQSRQHFDSVRDKVMRLYGANGERLNMDFADEGVKNSLTPIEESQVRYVALRFICIEFFHC